MEMEFSLKEFVDLVFEKCLWVIGGYDNTMSDTEEGCEDYVRAEETIKDLDYILWEACDELECDFRAEISADIRNLVRDKVFEKLHEEGY